MADMVSVLIPARNEVHLQETVDSLLAGARGQVEIIAVLDGWWPDPPLKDDPRLHIIHEPESKGMRPAINAAANIARGKWLMKCDAHCVFAPGWDVRLAKDCEPDWVLVPRRYNLRAKGWKRGDKLKEFQYISSPDDSRYPFKGCDWPEYATRVPARQKLVDLMTTQGSCWFQHRDLFFEHGCLDTVNYGIMGREAQEVCLKAWLSGGRMMLDRNTWYAHYKRRPRERPYKRPNAEWAKSAAWAVECWTNDKWEGQTRPFKWLINHFKPIPAWHEKNALTANRYIQEKFNLGHAGKYPRKIKGMNRAGFCELVANLGYKVGAEIGVEKGELAAMWFEHIPGVKMYLVDQYCDYDGARKRGRNHDDAKRMAHEKVNGCNAVFVEKLSMDAVRDFDDESLDFVYIDGNHLYEYVMQDIIEWTKKVRRGGMVAGHDYYARKDPFAKTGCRAKLAVDQYAAAMAISPVYLTDNRRNVETRADRRTSWFWIKR